MAFVALGIVFGATQGQRNEGGITFGVLVASVALQVLHVLWIVFASYSVVKHGENVVSTGFVIRSYLSVVTCFAAIYFTMVQGSAVAFDGSALFVANEYEEWELLVAMVYFSVTTMTTVGFGDIVPGHPLAFLVVMAQELSSITYNTFVFSRAMEHFAQTVEKERLEGIRKEKVVEELVGQMAVRTSRHNKDDRMKDEAIERIRSARRTREKGGIVKRVLRFVLVKHALLVVFALQVVLVGLSVSSYSAEDGLVYDITGDVPRSASLILISTVSVVAAIGSTVQMFDRLKRSVVAFRSLGAVYLSVALSFAGVFALMHGARENEFRIASYATDTEFFSVVGLYTQFAYTSFTIMTTTGFGDVTPQRATSFVAVIFLMIVGAFFTTIIFALSLTAIKGGLDDGSKVAYGPQGEELDEANDLEDDSSGEAILPLDLTVALPARRVQRNYAAKHFGHGGQLATNSVADMLMSRSTVPDTVMKDGKVVSPGAKSGVLGSPLARGRPAGLTGPTEVKRTTGVGPSPFVRGETVTPITRTGANGLHTTRGRGDAWSGDGSSGTSTPHSHMSSSMSSQGKRTWSKGEVRELNADEGREHRSRLDGPVARLSRQNSAKSGVATDVGLRAETTRNYSLITPSGGFDSLNALGGEGNVVAPPLAPPR